MHKEIPTSFIGGLQKGKVLQLQNDPDGEFRILITGAGETGKTGAWATLNCRDAGSRRGSFFYPEIGDEVIVGYINNDPRQPVVLGTFYGKDKPPPAVPEDRNSVKKYVSRSGIEISFDDTQKTLTLQTPAGNTVLLDEKESKIEIRDQHSNKIVMTHSGITIESPSSVMVKTAAHLVLDAAESISLRAKSVSIKASQDVKTEAANALFKADGITSIKGATVKIN